VGYFVGLGLGLADGGTNDNISGGCSCSTGGAGTFFTLCLALLALALWIHPIRKNNHFSVTATACFPTFSLTVDPFMDYI